ncbi:MAG TPA: electron transfer flavoprotein subunit beta/FixA family protein [Thermoanaerobaculia bacterium]|nr:electron transfer flavoprotein subunit beta/FixA family protein [Thermoanaerobaculia bacterium]
MKIVVCLKQVLDPDLPARDFKIDPQAKEAQRGNANLVTNIFCENALETALQLREAIPGTTVTALCYGGGEAEDSLRKALAMTADGAVLVAREGSSNPDPETVARVLAAAIRKEGEVDLVMVGRESGDWGVGQTGGLLAEELGFAALGFVDTVEVSTVEPGGDGLRLRRQTDSGYEVAEASLPLLVTITNSESNVPRIPKTRDVMMSYRKPLTTHTLADLGLDSEETRAGNGYYQVAELFVPEKQVQCELVAGDSLDEQVDQLARRIAHVVNAIG